ncbi:MAG: tryptophan synthase subunit alpha [Dehalococcoidia bacterium]
MTDRLAEMFARTRAEGRPAVIPFVPGGWPEPNATLEIVKAAVDGGADAMEIGIPFSDPIGDGVTNQVAYQHALEQGVTPPAILDSVRAIRAAGIRVPLLLMGYCNPLFAYGLDGFVRDAAEAGVDGLIIVDMPPDEADELEPLVRAAGLHMVYLLAPTSTAERIALVAEHASGFIYCVSVTGVTGTRSQLSDELPAFLERVRRQTDVPLAIGFGISTREHVESVGRIADAAVVGSAFVQAVTSAPPAERPGVVRAYVEEITGRGNGHSPGNG